MILRSIPHILFIRSNPCNPDVRVLKEVNSLLKGGAEVKILAWDRDNPSDSLLHQTLQNGDIKIQRLGIKATFGGGIKNLYALAKFQIKALIYLSTHNKEFDCIHACDFDTALVGFIASKIFNKKFVYDIFDYYVDAYSVPKILKPLIKKLDTYIINQADKVIICSEQRKAQIFPAKPKDLFVIHNSPQSHPINSTIPQTSQIKIAYIGVLQKGRFLEELLEIVSENKDFELHIGGFGILEAEVIAFAKAHSNITYYGKIPYEQTLQIEKSCDVMLALYDPNIKNHHFSAPNKFYEALNLAKPIVMIKDTGMSEIISSQNLGEVIEFSKTNLINAIKKCFFEDSTAKRQARKDLYEKSYSWEIMEKRLFNLYAKLFPNFPKKPMIWVIFGTRPEAIKMCPLIKELKKYPNFDTFLVLSGQHKDLVHPILKLFELKEDYNLNIASSSQTPSDITSKILDKLQEIFKHSKPDIMLIHGDTSTSFGAALACFYHQIPLAHIEAGLRTYNIFAPYPEEFNRQAISLVANLHFAPTNTSKQNLIREHKDPQNIFVVGNTAIDTLKTTIKKDYPLALLEWVGKDRLIVLTAHRRENIPQGLKNIFKAIKSLLEALPNIKIIYPIHPNPIISKIAKEILGNLENLKIIPPLDVADFHNLLNRSDLILTDSGGIQEEAPSLGKPVLVLRESSERTEGIEAGTLRLVGTDSQKIFAEALEILTNPVLYNQIAQTKNPYGEGDSSEKIAKILNNFIANKYPMGGGAKLKHKAPLPRELYAA